MCPRSVFNFLRPTVKLVYSWGELVFFLKGQIVNIAVCVGCMFSAVTIQLCGSGNEATDNMNEWRCIPIKLYRWTLIFEFHVTFMGHGI